jgi:protoporphyrinogen oxidase
LTCTCCDQTISASASCRPSAKAVRHNSTWTISHPHLQEVCPIRSESVLSGGNEKPSCGGAVADPFDAIIIGAGPAGLTAAYLLGKAGKKVLVLEQDEKYVGGISRTVEHDGFLFDIGGHRFFSKSSAVVDLWNEILPDDFLERPRMSRIYYRGKFYSYPLRAFEALKNLGIVTSCACLLSYLVATARPIRTPVSFHDWVRNQFGERLFSIFFRSYTEKVWGMSCDEISADWAAQRIKGLNLGEAIWNGLQRSFRRNGAGTSIKTLIEGFRYPRRGPGMMWDAAARKVRDHNGSLAMGRRVVELALDAATGRWTVAAALRDASIERYSARNVISSAPLRDLANMVDLTQQARSAAESLSYRDFLIVALFVRGPNPFPDNWIYVHDPEVRVGRVQNFRSWSPELVPDPDLNCLGLEYFCFDHDSLWLADDPDLVALATDEVERIGLVARTAVVGGVVVRQPKAYPVYDRDYRANVDIVRREVEARYPTLHLVGRNGMHKYNNQDHAMMTAMLTVENILAGARLFDVWNVNEDAEYHETAGRNEVDALSSVRQVPRKLVAPAE